MRRSNAFLVWISILVLGSASYGAFLAMRRLAEAADPTAGSEALSGRVEHFKLLDQDGREFETKQHQGQVWVASYFFTSCPQICLQMNQTLAKLQEDPRFKDVKFVSITCDPDNDRPAVLAKYAERFKADSHRWVFLTGTLDEVTKIGEQFKVTVGKEVHSDRIVLIDRNGEIRGRFRATDADQLALAERTLVKILNEEAK